MLIIKQTEVDIVGLDKELSIGKTIIYPTETCYGLGCDASNEAAVEKVFKIKQRSDNKPVLVLTSDIDMVKEYVVWDQTLEVLAQKYWPGPLTIILNLKEKSVLARGAVGADGTVAFRVTSYPLVQELCRGLGRPLVSTSANLSGQENLYNFTDVLKIFADSNYQPDIIIDAGELLKQKPSTIIRVADGEIIVLRQGEIVLNLDQIKD